MGHGSATYSRAAPTPSDGATVRSIVVRLRGNEVLIADLLRKTNWNSLLELMR